MIFFWLFTTKYDFNGTFCEFGFELIPPLIIAETYTKENTNENIHLCTQPEILFDKENKKIIFSYCGKYFNYDEVFIDKHSIQCLEETNNFIVYSKTYSITEDNSKFLCVLLDAEKYFSRIKEEDSTLNHTAQGCQLNEEDKIAPYQKAALVRGEKTLEAWKSAIDAMIKVSVQCGEEGEKLRQQPDFNIMFNEINAELSGSQMTFFRKCLPDNHIDRTGGERGKN